MKTKIQIVAGLAIASWCMACATSPSPLVESVKTEYQDAASDPVVKEHASVELYEAEEVVSDLERAWQREKEDAEIEHLAALARNKLDITRTRAEAGAFQAQLAELGKRRDDLRLKARALETTIARDRANRAEATADTERARADMASQIAESRGAELADVAARARQLEEQVAEFETRQEQRGLVVSMQDVLFEFDSAELKSGATRGLERLAEFVNEYPDRDILIEGHTDAVGSDQYNQSLSKARADSVASFLQNLGVARNRIETRGLGESAPVASNDNQAGRQQNRRVELVLENQPRAAR